MNDGLGQLRHVISKHGLLAKRSLGQHFLLDLNLTRRIARAAAPLHTFTIVEVGPGPGGLTRALLMEGAEKVCAVELDKRSIPALEEVSAAYPGRLEIIQADARTISWPALVKGPAKVVANLPFNIATPLLVGWLTSEPWPPWFQSLTLMFQKEVAERIAAKAGSKEYGRLSVLSQWRCDTRKLFDVDPRAFVPPPKVVSSVVQITPRENAVAPCRGEVLERITFHAFSHRRKMLRSSLKSMTPRSEELLALAGIDATLRAEQLTVGDFCRMAAIFQHF